MWMWGEGKKPRLDSFEKKYGIRGSMVTAVPLIKGLAAGMGLGSVDVPGATGDYNTNYAGKAEAALKILSREDFVFVHIEAPDECGHDGDVRLKVKSIERIDNEIVEPIFAEMEKRGEPFRMLIMPDHATPISVRTHTIEPVPFLVYDSRDKKSGAAAFDEESCTRSGIVLEQGFTLMGRFLRDDSFNCD
jgi:2,3-bisphosphoglycerate-independent phosphoglycerate mutase